jgi:hypothetical protein
VRALVAASIARLADAALIAVEDHGFAVRPTT